MNKTNSVCCARCEEYDTDEGHYCTFNDCPCHQTPYNRLREEVRKALSGYTSSKPEEEALIQAIFSPIDKYIETVADEIKAIEPQTPEVAETLCLVENLIRIRRKDK